MSIAPLVPVVVTGIIPSTCRRAYAGESSFLEGLFGGTGFGLYSLCTSSRSPAGLRRWRVGDRVGDLSAVLGGVVSAWPRALSGLGCGETNAAGENGRRRGSETRTIGVVGDTGITQPPPMLDVVASIPVG